MLSKVYFYKNKRVFDYKKDNNEVKSFIIEALNCLFHFLMNIHKSVCVFRGKDNLPYLIGYKIQNKFLYLLNFSLLEVLLIG